MPSQFKSILYCVIIATIFYSCNEQSITEVNQSEINKYSFEVVDFFNTVEVIYSYYDDSLGWQKNFTSEEIDNISLKYYKALYKNYIDYYFYFLELHNEWEQEVIANNYNIIHARPALKLRRIREKIAEYKSATFAELLQVPYFLRVRIIRMENSFYYSESIGLFFRRTNMIAKIEDVIKGKYKFNNTDTIKICYLNDWYNFSENRFEIDNSYFVPFKPWQIESKANYSYGVYFLPDDNNGVYPIIDEFIETPRNYFGTGETTRWTDFKSYFIENYIIILGLK